MIAEITGLIRKCLIVLIPFGGAIVHLYTMSPDPRNAIGLIGTSITFGFFMGMIAITLLAKFTGHTESRDQ